MTARLTREDSRGKTKAVVKRGGKPFLPRGLLGQTSWEPPVQSPKSDGVRGCPAGGQSRFVALHVTAVATWEGEERNGPEWMGGREEERGGTEG